MKHWLTKHLFTSLTLLMLASVAAPSFAGDWPSWPVWLAEFKKEAVADGIDPTFFDNVFQDITPNKTVINLDKRQPEKRLTFLQYRTTRADNYRIVIGRKEYKRHQQLLEKIGNEYGVDPCVITAIWGMETSYGHYMGDFPVIKALATLAYNPRRADHFRSELLIALHILQDGHVLPEHFKGEWAGASGQCQFLPSSWKRYAVDYDKNGHKDIWTNLDDAFASMANYLAQNGWHNNQPWATEVTLPPNFDNSLINNSKKTVAEWLALGVRPAAGKNLSNSQLIAGLIKPDGGPIFLVYNNFNVILRYNKSNYYAGTIGYLADQICRR